MKETPLVTVTIPCHNYAKYVKRAILSVVKQTHKNIELIVINDGSTDQSDQIIAQLQSDHAFKYVKQENQGIIATRNLAVSLATGEFQMQLDADDYLDTSYVEKCLQAAQKNAADIIYTQAQVFGRADFVTQYIDYDLEKLKHDNFIHASALVRSSILPKDPYDPYLNDKGYEDWDVFLGLCLDGAQAKLVDEPLLHYRKHADYRSRSDEFADVYKEMLVRHHIWSKQNAKHPEEFWYFSSQIQTLLQMINIHSDQLELEQLREQSLQKDQQIQQLTEDLDKVRLRVTQLEKRDLVTIAQKVKRKLLKYYAVVAKRP